MALDSFLVCYITKQTMENSMQVNVYFNLQLGKRVSLRLDLETGGNIRRNPYIFLVKLVPIGPGNIEFRSIIQFPLVRPVSLQDLLEQLQDLNEIPSWQRYVGGPII